MLRKVLILSGFTSSISGSSKKKLKSELDQIEAKKEELQRMMEKLKQMRAQMGMENNMPLGKAPNESPDNR